MKIFASTTLARLFKDQTGVTLIEYGLALTLAIGVGVGALVALTNSVNPIIKSASEQLTN